MTSANRHFFLCPPTYYQIEYQINDWMNIDNQVDQSQAVKQWQSLVDTYKSLNTEITFLDALEGIPELVFPGDSVFLLGKTVIASNFRHQERQPEVAPKMAWFEERGYTVKTLPENLHFEGNAEAIRWNDRFFCGYGIRTDQETIPALAKMIDREIIPLKLCAPFFHLDVAVCPLDDESVGYVPDAFDPESVAMIRSIVPNPIPVNLNEAHLLACNSITVDRNVILSTPSVPEFTKELERNNFKPIALNLSEFHKSGGGVKCLTLENY